MTRRFLHAGTFAIAALWAGFVGGCDDCNPPPREPRDPHVVRDGHGLEPRRDVVSPVTVRAPIYACANTAHVSGYAPNATVSVLVDGVVAGSGSSPITTGLLINVSSAFVAGQRVTAVQEVDGFTSAPSNQVIVTSHTADYPNGMPQPRLDPAPLLACGRAVGIQGAVPGAWVQVIAENPAAGGGFDPPATIGTTVGGSYAITSAFVQGARVHAESGLCTDRSPNSPIEVVQAAPAALPPPSLDPVPDGTEVVVVRGPPPDGLAHGATLDVFADDEPPPGRVGGQPTPGGPPGQQVLIHPAATHPGNYTATQALCATSPPSTPVGVTPCSELGAPIIRPPLPGDTNIQVIEAAPGARILVYADGEEVGDGGGSSVNLVRPLEPGEVVKVIQQVGSCLSSWVYQVTVECAAGGDPSGCSADWPTFRQNALRNAQQTHPSVLADPYAVPRLQVRWQFRPPGAAAFRASPIVFEGRVFVGNGNGRLYALDAASGALLWEYPPPGQPALTSQYTCNPSSFGIASSAAIAGFRDRNLVIFAAPDRSIGAGLGSGRLFALDPATGAEVWKSPEVAVLNGSTMGSVSELHEQIGYSAPLVFNGRVYVGIANHCDNPIQNGRIAAVEVTNGTLVGGFSFFSTGGRGGGIWSALAGGLTGSGVYATTGNTRSYCSGCGTEPTPNHGLSMLRVDAGSGALVWKLQPVPFALDGDPDWASGPALTDASCGALVASTQKDGWSYAASAASASAPAPSVRWQFPATGWPFTPADGTVHGDTRYLIPGAIWNDVFLTTTGGEAATTALHVGFNKIHALELCSASRIRWIAEIPGTVEADYQLGPPSVTHGIVFVGTARGHLVALADPSRWYTAALRCSQPQVAVADCATNGFSLVPDPKVLLDLDLDPANGSDRIATEPVLAGGRVFVATGGGVLYMLEPR